MFEQVKDLIDRLDEVERALADPYVVQDQDRFRRLIREQNEIAPIVRTYREYLSAVESEAECRSILENESDEELRAMAKEELPGYSDEIGRLTESLKRLLIPKDPNDEKNVFVEIRAGAGGDEAALFAADLWRMYSRYAERKGYKVTVIDENEIELGGFKELVFQVEGAGAYSRFKYESGVHRVQRVPVTESGGRIHTSTVTVAVMPETEAVDFELNMDDLRIDVFRSSGAGGQKVNKTSSAIRITHIPTGIVVQCQNERSQYQNKDKALEMLRAKLFAMEQEKQNAAITENRRSQVGSGDRSEKIRTYNYPQTRITDHRIKMTIYKFDDFLNGNLDELIDALTTAEQTENCWNSRADPAGGKEKQHEKP